MDHPLLRAGIYLAGGNQCLFLRPQARDLPRHLRIRGAWLIFLEFTFLRVAWTFNFDFKQYEMAGVIWVIGCCMILMAGLVKLPVAGIGAIGVVIIAAHNLMDTHMGAVAGRARPEPLLRSLENFLCWVLRRADPVWSQRSERHCAVLNHSMDWVMAAGYAFGKALVLDPAQRNRLCLAIGLSAVGLFLVLRGFNLYGDPRPWHAATHRT